MEWLIESHQKFPESFNEVWLSTAYGYPTIDKHLLLATELTAEAEEFRKNKIRVSLQISNTIGHGQYMSGKDCSAFGNELQGARRLVGHDGTVAEYSFCWRDERFLKYIEQQVQSYVESIKPEDVWIDDDLRATNHAPVQFGCFCEDCVQTFNKLYGYEFDRETLVYQLLHGEISVRERYVEFIRAGLSTLTECICKAAVTAKPGITMGLEYGSNGCYAGFGCDFILDKMYQVTGKPPMYRAGEGAYRDHNPNELIRKAYCVAYQHAMLPDYVTCLCPEIENTPNNAMGKTMYGTALESTLNFAMGATDCSFAMTGQCPEESEFYEKGFKIFADHVPYWERLAQISKQTYGGGVWYAYAKQPHLRASEENETLESLTREMYDMANDLLRIGVPISYDRKGCTVTLLHPCVARQMQKEELEDLLESNVITDGATVLYLQNIGIDLGFTLREMSSEEASIYRETYTEHVVNPEAGHSFKTGFFTQGFGSHAIISKCPERSEVIGAYQGSEMADVIFETSKGGKWAVIGYGLWKSIVPSVQRKRIQNVMDYIGNELLPARILNGVQAVLMPRVSKETGQTVAVTILNCTIEKQENIQVLIRRPKATDFCLWSYRNEGQKCVVEKKGEEYVVTIPTIEPWSVITIDVEGKEMGNENNKC